MELENDFENDLVSALKHVVDCNRWFYAGDTRKLNSCTRFFSGDGEDVVLIHVPPDQYYAMDASCPHEGGPLDLGDIEDIDGHLCIVCPWHSFDFRLDNGESTSGLKQQTYNVRVVEGKVYINTSAELSIKDPTLDVASSQGKHCPRNVRVVEGKVYINTSAELSIKDPTLDVTSSQSKHCPRNVCVEEGKVYIYTSAELSIKDPTLDVTSSQGKHCPRNVCVEEGKVYIYTSAELSIKDPTLDVTSSQGKHCPRNVCVEEGKVYIYTSAELSIKDPTLDVTSSQGKHCPRNVCVEEGKVYINTSAELSIKDPTLDVTSSQGNKHVGGASPGESSENTLCHWAVRILCTADPTEKVRLTHEIQRKWESGEISEIGSCTPPDQPDRIEGLNVVAPGKIKRGKGGTLANRIATLHSLANIEQCAIDLSWDVIARFGDTQLNGKPLPREFFSDFVKVARDEAKHFKMLDDRLHMLDSHFGSHPVHNGLWQSATETKDDLLARLAVVHMVHEARGLDVHPKTQERFSRQNDSDSVDMLEVIYTDEITHVAAGLKWFTYVCRNSKPVLDCIPTFHELVKAHFRGFLKPPFNEEGRQTAGMTKEWYLPLVKPTNQLIDSSSNRTQRDDAVKCKDTKITDPEESASSSYRQQKNAAVGSKDTDVEGR